MEPTTPSPQTLDPARQGVSFVPDRPSAPTPLDAVVVAFTGLGYALSARAILLLTVIGSFVLAVLAMQDPNAIRLWTLVAYCCLTVFPVTILEIRKR